jgi:hypothetical protein
MTISGRGVLLVGPGFSGALALTGRLRGWGFRCQLAANLRAARELLESVRVDMVLTNTHLSDGTGFELAVSLSGMPVTVFVCVPIEGSCLWLPAIDRGRVCLGLPALRPSEFASSLEEMARRLPPEPQANSAAPKAGVS